MKVVLSGGGTLGPVIPLLAVREAILKKYPKTDFVWVGTKNGPERTIIESASVPFFTIGAGKWRRYVSLWNFTDLIKILIAFWQAVFFIIKEKPDLLISAGGFVSVPLHWAGALLGVPTWVHQQDVRVGLANKLMFLFAKKITTALKETSDSIRRQSEWIGNPCRDEIADAGLSLDNSQIRKNFTIPDGVPVIFALGGGTGSASINKIILEAIGHWDKNWHIIHLVGKERPRELSERAGEAFSNYHVFQFFTDEMKDAYRIADVVVARAGFGTLTELAVLKKAAVILPMYDTHQEYNARYFEERSGILVLEKTLNSGLKLAQIVKELVANPERRSTLGSRLQQLLPRSAPEKIIAIVEELIKSSF